MPNRSVNELMGGKGHEAKSKDLEVEDLPELLGERCPEIKFNPVGRIRLVSALRQRFGDNWRHLPGLANVMKKFDTEAEFAVKVERMKQIKAAKKRD